MLQQAEQIKEEGNGYFKGKNFSAAIDSYSRAIDILSDFEKLDVNEKEKSAENEGSKALAVNHANRALCRILIQDFAGAVEDCNKALSIQPGYTKALYRRAKAFQGMGEPAKSMEDLTKLIHLEPKNSQAKDLASEVKDSLMKMNSKINSVDEIMTQLNRMKIPVNKESMSEGIQWIPRLLSRFENDKISKVEIINKYKAVNFFLKNIIDVHSILDWRVACIKAIVTILNGVKEFADIRVAIAQNINSENDFALVRNLVTLYLETARNIKEIEDSSSQKNLVKLTKDLSKGTRMVICLFSESLEYAQIRSIILEDLSRSFAHYDSQLPVEMNVFQNLLDLFEGVAARSVAGVLSQENSVSPFILDSEIRTMFLKKLVTSNALTYPKLKEQIVSAVVLCSGRPQAAGKVDPTTLDN